MNIKVVIAILCATCLSFAAPSAKEFYSGVERHLRELHSLEIGYTASGLGFPDEGAEGRLIWIKPDRFYHEGPEWIHCESGDLQWRYLKAQNTLIYDRADGRGEWLPENMLLNLSKSLSPTTLEVNDFNITLTLDSDSPEASGVVTMLFKLDQKRPLEIVFDKDDGSDVKYTIGMWNEGVEIPDTLFTPPPVPAENLIDFRAARRSD